MNTNPAVHVSTYWRCANEWPEIIRGRIAWLDPAAVIAGCLIFALMLFVPALLNDGDTFWQIRTGEWILDHHSIPTTDPFSFTAGDRRWFPHEWLAEVLMALAYRTAGMQGVMALAAAAIGLTATVLLQHLRRFFPAVYAVAALILALANAAPSMLARPHLLAWPCLALWCSGLVIARANRSAPSLALLPVMAIWVNLHGSFMAGLLLPGVFMVEALFDRDSDRRQVLSSWTLFILASWLTALLNPEFTAGVLFPFRLLGMSSLAGINEWQSADFSTLQPLEVVILAGLALGFSGKVKLPPARLLLFLALMHSALSHGRHQQLLGIVGALVLAEPLGKALGRGAAEPLGAAWRRLAAGAAMIALAGFVGRVILPLSPERTGAAFAAVLEHAPPSLRAQPVLNDYRYGGQLIFSGVRPFIDGRSDLYGDAFLSRYSSIVSLGPAELRDALSKYGIAWTIFPLGSPITHLLDAMPGWQRLIERGDRVIHTRRQQSTPS